MFWYDLVNRTKENIIKLLEFMLKPVQYFFTVEKMNKRYRKKKDKLSLDKCEELVARALAKNLIKNRQDSIRLHVGRLDTEYYGGIDLRFVGSSIKMSRKERMAYYKLDMYEKEVQERIINRVKKYKNIKVEKEVEELHRWDVNMYKEYEHTYKLSYKK